MTFGLWARRATKLLHPAIYWCRWPDLNRYGNFFPTDFKSVASADSATSACFKPNYYSIGFFICQYLFKKSWKNFILFLLLSYCMQKISWICAKNHFSHNTLCLCIVATHSPSVAFGTSSLPEGAFKKVTYCNIIIVTFCYTKIKRFIDFRSMIWKWRAYAR